MRFYHSYSKYSHTILHMGSIHRYPKDKTQIEKKERERERAIVNAMVTPLLAIGHTRFYPNMTYGMSSTF